MNTKELIGNRIKELRKKRGLSQEKLSEKAEITPNYLSRVERGTENPTLDMFIRLANALEVEMWEVFDFDYNVRQGRKDLKVTVNKFFKEADEETLRLAVKIIRVMVR